MFNIVVIGNVKCWRKYVVKMAQKQLKKLQ